MNKFYLCIRVPVGAGYYRHLPVMRFDGWHLSIIEEQADKIIEHMPAGTGYRLWRGYVGGDPVVRRGWSPVEVTQ